MDILSGTASAFRVDFKTPLGSVIPTVGSVTYSLYNHTGALLVTDQPLTPSTNSTGVSIPVTIAHNTKSPMNAFEKRRIIVKWMDSGQQYTSTVTYRIIPLPFYSAYPEQVRTFFGYNEDELRDDEIDLFGAYLELKSLLNMDLLLVGADLMEQRANDAIVLLAAIKLVPSLRIRTPRESSSGTDTFARFATTPDFDKLEALAKARLDAILGDLGYVISTPSIPTMVILTTPTDAITGV